MEIAGKIEHLGIMRKNCIVCSFVMGFLIASWVFRWPGCFLINIRLQFCHN